MAPAPAREPVGVMDPLATAPSIDPQRPHESGTAVRLLRALAPWTAPAERTENGPTDAASAETAASATAPPVATAEAPTEPAASGEAPTGETPISEAISEGAEEHKPEDKPA